MTESEEKAKEWLNRNYVDSLELEALKRRLERMQSDIEKVCKPIKLREVQEGLGFGNNQEDKMADYMDMSGDLSNRYLQLLRKDGETLRVINKLDSQIYRTILIERYVNRLKWDQVLKHIHIDRSTLFRYHLQALSAILPFIPEEVKK